jgi:hypothetical protein
MANALEHLALPTLKHNLKDCAICRVKYRTVKKQPVGRVMTDAELIRREQQIRVSRMLHGPEQPVGDMFRYRELDAEKASPPTNSSTK